MRKLLLTVGALLAALPTYAKNLALPEKSPIATITVPNSWKMEDIEYGYSARSPDGDIFFSAEYATGARVDRMMDNNTKWMKENKITATKEPMEREIDIGGIRGKLLRIVGKDENGPTIVDFLFMPAGEKRLIMLTLWGSEEERASNQADIDTIQSSLKPIK